MAIQDIFADIEAGFGKLKSLSELAAEIEPGIEKIAEVANKGAKLGEMFGGFAGPYGPEVLAVSKMVDDISTGVLAALAAHKTDNANGVDTATSQAALAANIAQVVVASGAIKNVDTAAEVKAIAAQVQVATNAPKIGLLG